MTQNEAQTNCKKHSSLDVVDIHLAFVPELERALPIFLAERVCLVDLGVLWEFAICFHCKREVWSLRRQLLI